METVWSTALFSTTFPLAMWLELTVMIAAEKGPSEPLPALHPELRNDNSESSVTSRLKVMNARAFPEILFICPS
jgi:hypothetical protein